MSQYEDFPMPEDYPDYPSHTQVLAYFQSYARHFDLEKYIRFNTEIKKVIKKENETWEITKGDSSSEIFDYLIVANGHHAVLRHPDFASDFKGEYLHSHDFKNNSPFKDKRVLVVGVGNSGCDYASEISRVADYVAMSIRTPQYIIPKFLMGKPVDVAANIIYKIPKFMRPLVQRISIAIQLGSYKSYGLETPKHKLLEAHPTINSEVLYKIKHGKISPKKGIEKVEEKQVRFTDGQVEEFDVLLAATGYKIVTSFFDKDFLDYSEADEVPLYLRMFHTKHPSLFFIGLFQPQGAIWPCADRQAKIAANKIMGWYKIPNNIEQLALKDSADINKRFLSRKRHTIEVDYHDFMDELKKEIPKDAPLWKVV